MHLISYFLLLLFGTFCAADLDFVKDLLLLDDDNDDAADNDTQLARADRVDNLIDTKLRNSPILRSIAYLADYLNDSDDDDYSDDEYLDDPGFGRLPPRPSPCMRPCPRIYRPICASVNGVPQTMPSKCDFDNRVRCANMENKRGKKRTKIRFLYNGECRNSPKVFGGPGPGSGPINATLPIYKVGGDGPIMGGGVISGIRSASGSGSGSGNTYRDRRNRIIERLSRLLNL